MLLKSRSLRMAVASLLLVMGMGAAVPAMADDGIEPYHHEDTDFHFNLGVYGAGMTAGTAGEQKDETSPLFIYPTDITFDKCKVYGEGSHDQYGPWTDGDILTVNEFGILYRSDTNERLLLKTDIKECEYSWALGVVRHEGRGEANRYRARSIRPALLSAHHPFLLSHTSTKWGLPKSEFYGLPCEPVWGDGRVQPPS